MENKVLRFVKDQLDITNKMVDVDNGSDHNHSQFLLGTQNAYETIRFEMEEGSLKEDVDEFPTRKVCFFKLKGGKYLTKDGKEITNDMLVKYPHQMNDVWSFIILD